MILRAGECFQARPSEATYALEHRCSSGVLTVRAGSLFDHDPVVIGLMLGDVVSDPDRALDPQGQPRPGGQHDGFLDPRASVAKPHGFPGESQHAVADAHHLRAADKSVNGDRGNLDFDEGRPGAQRVHRLPVRCRFLISWPVTPRRCRPGAVLHRPALPRRGSPLPRYRPLRAQDARCADRRGGRRIPRQVRRWAINRPEARSRVQPASLRRHLRS
jgi:hypothetical protein